LKARRAFDIHIFNLANGNHDYHFEVSGSFFELFENEMFSTGKLTADVSLQKSESMIQMIFKVEGTIELTCDRSLDLFDQPISFENTMIYKFGEEEKELSEDVMIILNNTQTINIADLLFEFIGLQVPMKKLHPRFQEEEEDDDDQEEGVMVYSSTVDDSKTEEQQEEDVDPRWAALKKLKNKK